MYQRLRDYLTARIPTDEATLESICACFTPLKTRRNQLLLQYGETCQHYYFVNRGVHPAFHVEQRRAGDVTILRV